MDNIQSFDPGTVVIQEGTTGTSAFIIMSGTVEVTKKTEKREIVMATLRKGQVFGEMGLIEDRPRSATVKAVSKLKVRVIDRETFNVLFRSNPAVLIPIMKILFERLRHASNMVAERTSDFDLETETETSLQIVMEGETDAAKRALDNREMTIRRFPFLIGRYSVNPDSDVFHNNDLSIKERKPFVISRNHLALTNKAHQVWVVDRGSTFGTIVNGKQIGGRSREYRAPLDKDINQVIIGPADSSHIFLLRITPRT